MEEDIQPVCSTSKFPEYVPSWKGKAEVPKELEATKSAFQTPLLPDGISFEGSALGRVPTMKFEDCDLTNSENFPHLQMKSLMKQSKELPVTALKTHK